MYNKSIGVIMESLSSSQLAFYVLHGLNNISYNSNHFDCTIFLENLDRPCIPNLCSIMELTQIWNFHGFLISTTIDNTVYSLKAATNAKKIFYIWDLEWLRHKKDYKYNLSILRNPNLSLVTRSDDYANITENYCGIKPRVIERFNFGELISWI